MSDVNVISRTQRIVVAPASSSVSVISTGPTGPTGPPGPAHPSGVSEITGISCRGTVPTVIPPGGLGQVITLDPVNGILEKLGTDVEIVDAGASTHQLRILTAGLYHINGYVRIDANAAPAGSFLGLRVNGLCRRRHMFVPTAWTSVTISVEANLKPSDLVCMFGYSTGAPWVALAGVNTEIDPYTPLLDIWRVAAGPKGDPA
jgi:hypothetical protein